MSNNCEDCVVCYESLESGVIKLPCGHSFHLECVKNQKNQNCALCRAPHNIPISYKENIDAEENIDWFFVIIDSEDVRNGDDFYLPQDIYDPFNENLNSMPDPNGMEDDI